MPRHRQPLTLVLLQAREVTMKFFRASLNKQELLALPSAEWVKDSETCSASGGGAIKALACLRLEPDGE